MLTDKTLGLVIEIRWEGPFSVDTVLKDHHGAGDYGVYQIYGTHNIMGSDSLLYVGKACDQPFGVRLAAHTKEWVEWEPSSVGVYLGFLGGADSMSESRWPEWDKQIDLAERLLIYYSAPPYNSSGLRSFGDVPECLLLNFGQRHRLPIELSTLWEHSSWTNGTWKPYS